MTDAIIRTESPQSNVGMALTSSITTTITNIATSTETPTSRITIITTLFRMTTTDTGSRTTSGDIMTAVTVKHSGELIGGTVLPSACFLAADLWDFRSLPPARGRLA